MSARATRRVIVGYDATDSAERALSWALRRAGREGQVVLVHAGSSRSHTAAELPFLERGDVFDAVAECRVELREGPPADALMVVADELEADEIIIGTRRRTRLLPGSPSVCTQLLQRSDRPVVVIP